MLRKTETSVKSANRLTRSQSWTYILGAAILGLWWWKVAIIVQVLKASVGDRRQKLDAY
jgi:hypothetical protein